MRRGGRIAGLDQPVPVRDRARHGELGVEPGLVALRGDLIDIGLGRAHRRLAEEAGGLGAARQATGGGVAAARPGPARSRPRRRRRRARG